MPDVEDLVYRLKKRAEIRRQIAGRKSVAEGKPDRIADLLDEAAAEIERFRQADCRYRVTCGRCGEVHTNDNLNLYMDPAKQMAVAYRVCVFCEHCLEFTRPNGGPARLDGKKFVTREEDRLEAEAELL